MRRGKMHPKTSNWIAVRPTANVVTRKPITTIDHVAAIGAAAAGVAVAGDVSCSAISWILSGVNK